MSYHPVISKKVKQEFIWKIYDMHKLIDSGYYSQGELKRIVEDTQGLINHIQEILSLPPPQTLPSRQRDRGSSSQTKKRWVVKQSSPSSVPLPKSLVPTGTEVGVLLCHGRIHEYPIELPIVKWITVDNRPEAYPDVIADILNATDLTNKLGLNMYDYVVSYHCPLSDTDMIEMIRNSRNLLKDDGIFIQRDGVTRITNRLSDIEVEKVPRQIIAKTRKELHEKYAKGIKENDPVIMAKIKEYLDILIKQGAIVLGH